MLKTLFALVFLATLGVGGYAAWYAATPVPVAQLPVTFDLPPGTRFRSAIQIIRRSGVSIGTYEFEILARRHLKDLRLDAHIEYR